MKLYDGAGPNPKVVRFFLAEKALSLPTVKVDIITAENRTPAHLRRNPSGQIPTLETENGGFISEITVICEYLEERFPNPPLIGTTPEERGETRMWVRKIDLNICEPMGNAFRFGEGLDFFKDRIHCEPEISAGLKRLVEANLKWLDGQLAGRSWIAGERFTLADILLFSFVFFFGKRGQAPDPALVNLAAWMERVNARPAAKA